MSRSIRMVELHDKESSNQELHTGNIVSNQAQTVRIRVTARSAILSANITELACKHDRGRAESKERMHRDQITMKSDCYRQCVVRADTEAVRVARACLLDGRNGARIEDHETIKETGRDTNKCTHENGRTGDGGKDETGQWRRSAGDCWLFYRGRRSCPRPGSSGT